MAAERKGAEPPSPNARTRLSGVCHTFAWLDAGIKGPARLSHRRRSASRMAAFIAQQQGENVAGEESGLWAPSGISLSGAKQSPLDLIRIGLIIQSITKEWK